MSGMKDTGAFAYLSTRVGRQEPSKAPYRPTSGVLSVKSCRWLGAGRREGCVVHGEGDVEGAAGGGVGFLEHQRVGSWHRGDRGVGELGPGGDADDVEAGVKGAVGADE